MTSGTGALRNSQIDRCRADASHCVIIPVQRATRYCEIPLGEVAQGCLRYVSFAVFKLLSCCKVHIVHIWESALRLET